ncbi:hypothetical protein [Candidatus Soleaferrea massiliensis]|uniref:hypothetical protein n=1 Tax=Candidatus Soleaferrea massiliensis TaxID=1470354 RepID=UPI00058C0F12|nr:hypothetical protein [Candidatus Soleaferrea massiliensis]
MRNLLSRYTLCVSYVLLYKLGYIARFEGRTKNKELERMIKRRIEAFETLHGTISIDDYME